MKGGTLGKGWKSCLVQGPRVSALCLQENSTGGRLAGAQPGDRGQQEVVAGQGWAGYPSSQPSCCSLPGEQPHHRQQPLPSASQPAGCGQHPFWSPASKAGTSFSPWPCCAGYVERERARPGVPRLRRGCGFHPPCTLPGDGHCRCQLPKWSPAGTLLATPHTEARRLDLLPGAAQDPRVATGLRPPSGAGGPRRCLHPGEGAGGPTTRGSFLVKVQAKPPTCRRPSPALQSTVVSKGGSGKPGDEPTLSWVCAPPACQPFGRDRGLGPPDPPLQQRLVRSDHSIARATTCAGGKKGDTTQTHTSPFPRAHFCNSVDRLVALRGQSPNFL